MPVPENETEAEILARRQVEALERIAEALERMADAAIGTNGCFNVSTWSNG